MKTKHLSMLIIKLLAVNFLMAQPIKVIFDTDMDSDVDDVGALAMLHGFANLGELDILGVMVSSLNPWAPGTVDVINTHYGRPDIPIGSVQRFGVYHRSLYTRNLYEEFQHDSALGEDTPEATGLYRKILASQPDGEVVIVTVGDLTNLSKLLNSNSDEHSELSGMDLVARKVKHLVCMGGRYPADTNPSPWGNFKPDPQSTKHVAKQWPTPIYFTGGGEFANSIPTGSIFFQEKYKDTPMVRAYQLFLKNWNRNWHHSADLIAVYVAARGHEPYFKLEKRGYNHIFENGTNLWRIEPNDDRHFLITEFADHIDPKEIAERFDAIMVAEKPVDRTY